MDTTFPDIIGQESAKRVLDFHIGGSLFQVPPVHYHIEVSFVLRLDIVIPLQVF